MKKTVKHRDDADTKAGFTILEVTLVTAFIALLLIAIATIFANISALFQKGATLKSVNEVGRNLVTEFTTALNSAPAIDTVSICNTLAKNNTSACLNDGAYKFIFQSVEGQYHDPVDSGNTSTVQLGGTFCTGDYSYVWNTFYGRDEKSLGRRRTLQLIYNGNPVEDEGEGKSFKLIKLKDPTYRVCSANVDENYNLKNSFTEQLQIDIKTLANGANNQTNTHEAGFLSTSDIDLELYELVIFPIAQDSVTLESLVPGTFILGAERGDVNIMRSGDYCDVTNVGGQGDGSGNLQDLGSNFNYCGINKFNFAARTAGNGV